MIQRPASAVPSCPGCTYEHLQRFARRAIRHIWRTVGVPRSHCPLTARERSPSRTCRAPGGQRHTRAVTREFPVTRRIPTRPGCRPGAPGVPRDRRPPRRRSSRSARSPCRKDSGIMARRAGHPWLSRLSRLSRGADVVVRAPHRTRRRALLLGDQALLGQPGGHGPGDILDQLARIARIGGPAQRRPHQAVIGQRVCLGLHAHDGRRVDIAR
jgi:hypothetical protein